MQHDPYQVLGVARSASDEDIKRAFRRRVLQTHPDRKGQPEASDEAFRRVKDAFEAIMRERSGGDMPPWAAEMVATWGRARAAAQRGDLGTAADEMQVLVGGVVEQVEHASAVARGQYQEVRRTVRVLGRLFGVGKGRAGRDSA